MTLFMFKKSVSRDTTRAISLNGIALLLLTLGLLSCTRLNYFGDTVYLTFDFFSWQFRELLTFSITYIFAR